MTGSRCLLDTSIIIQSFKNNKIVAQRLTAIGEIYVSVTVTGELNFGAYNSSDQQRHLTRNRIFLNDCTILPVDFMTSEFYGKIGATLTHKGRPIPENDIWIAATALQYNLPLFTADRHFREIDGLQLFNPLTSI